MDTRIFHESSLNQYSLHLNYDTEVIYSTTLPRSVIVDFCFL